MTRRINLSAIGLVFLVLMLVIGVVLGQQAGAQSEPANTKSGSSIQQRIAQRKAERKIKLDDITTSRLQTTCVRSQSKVRVLRDQFVTTLDKRSSVYRKVDAKLWVAIGSLKYINQDTFKLEQQRSQYIKQVIAFESSGKEFRQALEDMANMNCAADVNGYKAVLETVKLYNIKLREQANTLNGQILNKIKPTLTEYTDKLKPNTSQQ